MNQFSNNDSSQPIFAQDLRPQRREYVFEKSTYDNELEFLKMIADGDQDKLEQLLNSLTTVFRYSSSNYNFSKNALRHTQYSAVMLAAVASRKAIEAGISEIEAFTLSDLLIHRADQETETNKIHSYMKDFIRELTDRVYNLKRKNLTISGLSHLCIQYVDRHLYQKLTIKEIAKFYNFTPTYLAKLFFEDTGQKLSDYIRVMKLAEGKRLLEDGKLSSNEIATLLGYSSQSYFIHCFNQEFGITPKNFQKKNKSYAYIEDSSDKTI